MERRMDRCLGIYFGSFFCLFTLFLAWWLGGKDMLPQVPRNHWADGLAKNKAGREPPPPPSLLTGPALCVCLRPRQERVALGTELPALPAPPASGPPCQSRHGAALSGCTGPHFVLVILNRAGKSLKQKVGLQQQPSPFGGICTLPAEAVSCLGQIPRPNREMLRGSPGDAAGSANAELCSSPYLYTTF